MKVIYAIINLKNGKKYIGSTTNFSRRKYHHLNDLKNNNHHNIILQNSWNNNSPEFYKFIILERLNKTDDKFEKEQYWLDLYKSYDKENGYNICKFAYGPHGTNNVKKVYQFDFSGNLINTFENCTLAGEFCKIGSGGISACAREKYRFYSGYIWSYTEILNPDRIVLANSPSKRTTVSKLKMSKKASERTDNKKIVLKYTLDDIFLEEYESLNDASRKNNISTGQLSDCLNGKWEKAKGFKWKYKNN